MSEHVCQRCGKDTVAVCPICGKQVEVYSRIVGYLRPISSWNPGKQQELKDRQNYILGERWHND